MTDVSVSKADEPLPHHSHLQQTAPARTPSLTLSTDMRPSFPRSPNSNPNFSSLPPLTTTLPRPRAGSRVPSFVGKRVSAVSTASGRLAQSRPQSTIFPASHSTWPCTLVRDFAYDGAHALHYGPSQDPPSATSATASEFARRLSDPEVAPWRGGRTPWSGHSSEMEANFYAGQQLPALAYGDGPPWVEDEDLLSPIVTSSRHRKTQSDQDYFSSRNRDPGTGVRRTGHEDDDEDQRYYDDHDEDSGAKDANDDNFTFPGSGGPGHIPPPRKGSVFRLPPQQELAAQHDRSSSLQVAGSDKEENRYSRDYSFSIASPDEEMHGKAIALFDFESENNNELPLVEGQVLWISYRHGQGWLVAKDPSTGEDGLVPEAYVRLEREIQGGFGGLNGQVQVAPDEASPVGRETPRLSSPLAQDQAQPSGSPSSGAGAGAGAGPQQYPVVSHFTTSSKDLLPQHARSPHGNSLPPIAPGSGLAESMLAEDVRSQPEEESGSQNESPAEGEAPDTPQRAKGRGVG